MRFLLVLKWAKLIPTLDYLHLLFPISVTFLSHIFACLLPSHNLGYSSNITSSEKPSAITYIRKVPIPSPSLSHRLVLFFIGCVNLQLCVCVCVCECVCVCVCVWVCALSPPTLIRRRASWGNSHLTLFQYPQHIKHFLVYSRSSNDWKNEEKWSINVNKVFIRWVIKEM